jgi:hypothetical protein
VGARFHDERAGRHVVAEGVVHQVTRAEAGGEQRARGAPVVARGALRFVDGPGRREHARHGGPADDGREAAEGVGGARGVLPLEQLVLAQHREPGEGLAGGDRCCIDAGQQRRIGGGRPLHVRDLARQRLHLRGLATGGGARLERVEEIAGGHGAIRRVHASQRLRRL